MEMPGKPYQLVRGALAENKVVSHDVDKKHMTFSPVWRYAEYWLSKTHSAKKPWSETHQHVSTSDAESEPREHSDDT